MSRKPSPKPDDPEQSKRFIETAKELETDEDPKTFDRVMKRIVPRPSKRS
jgi:hypothetical protein